MEKANSVESLQELTSDSEGSYAGMSSPRDLQSPDFMKGFPTDKTEVGHFCCSSSYPCFHHAHFT